MYNGKNIFLKTKRKNFFYAIKGYRKLVKNRKLSHIRLLHNNIHHTTIKSIYFKPVSLFSENNISIKFEIILRQYLIQFLVRKFHFNYLMMVGGKKNIGFTIPKEWQTQANINSSKLNYLYNFNMILFALNRIIKSFSLLYFILLNNLKSNLINLKKLPFLIYERLSSN